MDILRVTCRWSGFAGAPGYSAFHFAAGGGFWDGGIIGDSAQSAADSAASRVRNAFFGINRLFPADVSLAVEPETEVLDSDTGEILGVIDVDPSPIASSTNESGYSAASGAVVNWRTNDYRFGRRIRGRTFLVPLIGSAYESDGTLTSSALTDLRAFGSDLIGSDGDVDFGVWSRPREGAGGVFATVVSASVPDMAAVLRSRRD